ncbi:PDZ domain-containing protein [Salipaludibacillus sp. LMS25]|jgi:PDZ domain-containing protein|uniref:SepM family pheromone-processing serine protease n=1 Tax=Salipaludibacillus sp. LMS25 TaxID=2924031 RepID=UPI0020D11E2D|nr:SepM family pheromone-processing serine protease [Salipaludibacillus sp. LMS25]UTR15205.1 PDZ domain-containing protein [Salipaludibacillus sp. LMS25]
MRETTYTTKKSWLKWLVLFGILFIINFVQLPYYFSVPGEAKILTEVIEVEDGNPYEGTFMLTTIRMGKANIVNYVWALASDKRELIPEEHVRPEGETDEEYHHRQLMMMTGSQELAVIVAYNYAGKEAYFENHGVLVTSVISGMAAEGNLEVGDRIVAIDGEEVLEIETLFDVLGQYSIGDNVPITFEREGDTYTVELQVDPFPEEIDPEGERGGIGIINPGTDRELVNTPEITIDTDQIGGPSAGLMFSLEIYNQLLDEDITKGHQIAGTGSIDEHGNVGRIGGVKQKVYASHEAGAEIFFAPAEQSEEGSNYEIALEAAESIGTDMEIVPVNTFEDALKYLESIS